MKLLVLSRRLFIFLQELFILCFHVVEIVKQSRQIFATQFSGLHLQLYQMFGYIGVFFFIIAGVSRPNLIDFFE